MGTKFAHFSVKGSSQAQVKNLIGLLPLKAGSIFSRISRMRPDIANKLEQAFLELTKMQQDDPKVSRSGFQPEDAKKALEYLHSTTTEYYIAQNHGWITVCSEEFGFESIENIALEISKISTKSIMTVADFDDDIFILNLLKNGKTITRHISGNADYYDMNETLGDITVISDNFEINGKEEELEAILKGADIWKKFEELEKLLNMWLWITRSELERHSKDGLRWQKVTIA
jgi:hypothetical protein